MKDEKVKGKPILMLCNKADIDEAKDEVHLVNALNVERLVNVARCPTRVEPSVATKNQGTKEGFKWIVKSVIANMSELGPRIDRDIEVEQKLETERREAVRQRLEEQKSKDPNDKEESIDDTLENEQPPGFVPIGEAIAAATEHQIPPSETIETVPLDAETAAVEPNEPESTIDFGALYGPSTSTASASFEVKDEPMEVVTFVPEEVNETPVKRGRGRPRVPRTQPEAPR